MSDNAQKPDMGPLISALFDNQIVETVLSPDAGTTAFVVATGDQIEIRPEFRSGEWAYRPIRAGNNLLRHGAVLLPSEPEEFGSLDHLLSEISSYVERYVSLTPQARALCVAYVLLSWTYDAFNELPYLRFKGDYGTGKTRALIVIGSLCYKAFFASGASTVSPIFHALDAFRGTLIFDEADFRFSDEKAELVKILNNGNARGFPVLRTQVTVKREFDPRAFAVFGPKIVGMRRPFEDRALESRFLTIEMRPGDMAGVPINLPDRQKEEARQLRNKLLMYRLRHRRSVMLDVELVDASLEPRMNQILMPLLSVVPDAGIRAAIRIAATAAQEESLSERSTSTEGHVLAVLARLHEAADGAISIASISKTFSAEFGSDYERPITNRWIGTQLRRLGLSLYKSNGIVVLVPGQEQLVALLCARYGVDVQAKVDHNRSE